MPVTCSSGDHRRRPPLAELLVSLVGALAVLAGAAGLIPAAAAVALAVAGACALACVRLAWLAGAPAAEPTPPATALPVPSRRVDVPVPPRRSATPVPSRRVAALLDAAVLSAGLTVAVLPLAGPPYRLPVVLAGLALSAPLYTLALAPAALVDRERRPGAARCVAGAAATLAGLALLVVLSAGHAPDRATLGVAPPLLAGALLTAAGAGRTATGERSRSGTAPAAGGDPVAPGPSVGPSTVAPGVPAADPSSGPAADPSAALADRRELLRRLAGRDGGALLVVDLHGLDDVPVEAVRVEATRRLWAARSPGDLVARLAGGGFVVLTDVGPVLAYALGTRLLTALAEPYPGGRPRVSIGLAEITGGDPEDVLRQAELARRRAVQLGRDRVEWYDAYLEEQFVRRLDVERALPGAVARGELDLVYQPVLALADRLPVGTEALLRWRSPVLGTVLPDELLPVAADLDLLDEVGRWVLDRACRQLAEWSESGRELWMAVNVTPRELAAPDFVARTATALAAYGVPPERLVVEIAEAAVDAELPTVAARLAGLRSLGVRVALDDFRAEHASLAQLRRLPVDLLKVGPHLVGPGAGGQRPLIDVVTNLGDRLGLEVVVEGLESGEQVARARRAGCRYGQGFALARPATAERVEAWFEEFPPILR